MYVLQGSATFGNRRGPAHHTLVLANKGEEDVSSMFPVLFIAWFCCVPTVWSLDHCGVECAFVLVERAYNLV